MRNETGNLGPRVGNQLAHAMQFLAQEVQLLGGIGGELNATEAGHFLV